MKTYSVIRFILWCAILIVGWFTWQLLGVEEPEKLRERISAYQLLHRVKDDEIRNLYTQTLGFLPDSNPIILPAVKSMRQLIDIRTMVNDALTDIMRHKYQSDSAQYYFTRFKTIVKTAEPAFDSIASNINLRNKGSLSGTLMYKGFFGENPEALPVYSQSGIRAHVVHLYVLYMQCILDEVILDMLQKHYFSTGEPPLVSNEILLEYGLDKKLMEADHPAIMFLGKTERVTIRLSGEILAGFGKEKFYSISAGDSLKTNSMLNMILLADAFTIQALQPTEQYVTFRGSGVWEFDVTPLKRGKHKIMFRSGVGKFQSPSDEGEYFIPVITKILKCSSPPDAYFSRYSFIFTIAL